jgi:hypothetical protein
MLREETPLVATPVRACRLSCPILLTAFPEPAKRPCDGLGPFRLLGRVDVEEGIDRLGPHRQGPEQRLGSAVAVGEGVDLAGFALRQERLQRVGEPERPQAEERLQAVGGDASKRSELNAAMGKASFTSPRGPFRLSSSHNPVQNFYLREMQDGKNTLVETVAEEFADPGTGCRLAS